MSRGAFRPGVGPGIEHLAARLGARFGAPAPVSPFESVALDAALGRARHVVLLLLDGVGTRQIGDHAASGALARARIGELRSVFPSSTAPAITALATGLPPHRHANPGWFAWHPGLARIVRTLPSDLRGEPAGTFEPTSLWRWHALTALMRPQPTVLQPAAIADSAFSRFAYRGARRLGYASLDELAAAVPAALDAQPAGGYVYAYAPHFDTIAHARGCRSDEAARILRDFDRLFERLADALASRDALLLATADHGFVDIADECQLRIEDWPLLVAGLERPLAGEPRVAFAQPRAGTERDWIDRFRAALGFAFDPVPTEALLAEGWFGEGDADSGFVSRSGSVTLVGRDGYAIGDTVAGERAPSFIGMHGGISEDEMRVPLAAVLGGSTPA